MESTYPPPGDPRIHVKRSVAKNLAKRGLSDEPIASEYTWYEFHDVVSQTALDAAARRAYEERSRQEVQLMVRTAEMTLKNADGSEFDLLDLHAGESLGIVIDATDLQNLRTVGGTNDQIRYLMDRGYDARAAETIARNADALANLDSVFHMKRLRVTLEDGRFEVEINLHNRIAIDTGESDDSV